MMNRDKFKQSIDKMNPSEDQKRRMLNKITENKYERKMFMNMKSMVPVALCCVFVLGGAVTLPNLMNNNTNSGVGIENPSETSPMGMRKFMNYDGNRYAFLNEGETYNSLKSQLGEELGTLELEIIEGEEENITKDFATTFAKGGKVYKIDSYDEDFRVAVEFDGNIYLCENVDNINEEEVNLSEYLDDSNLEEITSQIKIYDNSGMTELGSIKDITIDEFLNGLSESSEAQLESSDYEKLSSAQRFVLKFELEDGTTFDMSITPELKIAVVGDNYYDLTDAFAQKISSTFEGFSQEEMPQE